MIRVTLLSLLILFLCVYSWKDWFKGTCWLVLFIAIIQHPDMPKSIFGIPGFNLWNLLFINVMFSWLSDRRKNNLNWDMPLNLNVLFFIYMIVILISVLRLLSDQSGSIALGEYLPQYGELTFVVIFSEYIINCFKWSLLAFIIFDGARTEYRIKLLLWVVVAVYILLSLQVIKSMGFGSLTISGDELQSKAFKVLSSNVGFHRVNLSMILSGAFWLVFCMKEYVSIKKVYFIILPICSLIFVAQALTGGRMGYVTWAILGILLCSLKWRKYFLLAPFILIGIGAIAPSAIERVTMGFNDKNEAMDVGRPDFGNKELDVHEMTSGRILAWPMVIDAIYERPLVGYGRLAMINQAGISLKMIPIYGIGDTFPHPHNAYLELLLETGLIGAIPIFYLYYLFVKYSLSLFKDNRKSLYVVVGGASLSILLSLLVAAFGSQSFYPREGSVLMLSILGIMLRVYVDRDCSDKRSIKKGKNENYKK